MTPETLPEPDKKQRESTTIFPWVLAIIAAIILFGLEWTFTFLYLGLANGSDDYFISLFSSILTGSLLALVYFSMPALHQWRSRWSFLPLLLLDLFLGGGLLLGAVTLLSKGIPYWSTDYYQEQLTLLSYSMGICGSLLFKIVLLFLLLFKRSKKETIK